MEKSKSLLKDGILAGVIICSWTLFLIVTYGSDSILHFIPLLLLITQIILLLSYKSRKLLLLILLNPVAFCALYYIIKPTINYLKGTPTLMECTSYLPDAPSFDDSKSVYLDYYDDDCDAEGLYHYTIDINNFVTNGLISTFGNTAKK